VPGPLPAAGRGAEARGASARDVRDLALGLGFEFWGCPVGGWCVVRPDLGKGAAAGDTRGVCFAEG